MDEFEKYFQGGKTPRGALKQDEKEPEGLEKEIPVRLQAFRTQGLLKASTRIFRSMSLGPSWTLLHRTNGSH